MKYVLDGCGLLGGLEGDTDAASYRKAECKPFDAEAHAELLRCVEIGARETAKAARDAEIQPTLDLVDANLSPHLKDELAAENLASRVSASQRLDFSRFQACCKCWELPHLPAPPQAVAVFLAEEIEHGAKHLARLARSISIVHRALNFTDPTEDVLVRAILRLVRTEKKTSPPQSEKGND
jgi:hypothetical protein